MHQLHPALVAHETTSIASKVTIRAPVERVWEYTIDVNKWPDWCPTIQTAKIISAECLDVGMHFKLKQPLQSAKTWEVTDLQPLQKAEWRTVVPGFRAKHILSEGPVGVESLLELFFKPTWQPLQLLQRFAFRSALDRENYALKRVCEKQLEFHGYDSTKSTLLGN